MARQTTTAFGQDRRHAQEPRPPPVLLAHIAEPYEACYATPILPYIALLNDHTGPAALRVLRTSVVIVCWNTHRIAERLAEQRGLVFNFGCEGDLDSRADQAREIVLGARRATERWVTRAQMLACIPVDDDEERRCSSDCAGREHSRHQTADRIGPHHGTDPRHHPRPTVQGAGIAGTVLGLVAAGEYLDHYRPARSSEERVTRTVLRHEPVKDKAERLALEVVGAGPDRLEERVQRDLAEVALS